jgi:ribosomal protein S18 acetylase RimI-like enzyme
MNTLTSSISFRLADLTDSELVRAISEEAYVQAYLPVIGAVPKPAREDYGERIAQGQVWILLHEAVTAGVLVLERGEEEWLTIYSIAVSPMFQGRGFGRLLLDWADRMACAAGVAELRLYTNARMKGNIALYQRCGYEIFNTRPHPSRPGESLIDLKRAAKAPL